MSVQLIPKEQKIYAPQQKLQILKEWERTGNGIQVAEKYQIYSPNPLSVEKGSGVRGCFNKLKECRVALATSLSNGLAAPHACPSGHFARPPLLDAISY